MRKIVLLFLTCCFMLTCFFGCESSFTESGSGKFTIKISDSWDWQYSEMASYQNEHNRTYTWGDGPCSFIIIETHSEEFADFPKDAVYEAMRIKLKDSAGASISNPTKTTMAADNRYSEKYSALVERDGYSAKLVYHINVDGEYVYQVCYATPTEGDYYDFIAEAMEAINTMVIN